MTRSMRRTRSLLLVVLALFAVQVCSVAFAADTDIETQGPEDPSAAEAPIQVRISQGTASP
ncbi:MAG: hypothetical protein QMC73_08205 [Myxococcota bacterium]